MKNCWKNFFSPFTKIAGAKALLWGLAGLAVSVAAASFSGFHAHGLMQFGSASRDAWWLSALEYLIIWLIPAILFYGLGAALSRSRIRPVDVLGTTVFSLLPLAAMNLMQLLPGMRDVFAAIEKPTIDIAAMIETMMQPLFIVNMVVMLAAFVLMLVWLFGAVRVSCNLKGWRLWTVYLVGVIGGDILCRIVIGMLY